MDCFTQDNWRGTVITKFKNLTNANDLRLTGHLTFKIPIVYNAGHHFSWMGGIDRVVKKISSVVEGNVEVAFNEKLREEKREQFIKAMRDGYFGDVNKPLFKIVKYDISQINLPYLNEFVKKYPYFLRKYDFAED